MTINIISLSLGAQEGIRPNSTANIPKCSKIFFINFDGMGPFEARTEPEEVFQYFHEFYGEFHGECARYIKITHFISIPFSGVFSP